jgi:hypothetical protein
MREIMRKTARQTENTVDSSVNTQQTEGTLNPYFQALPVKTQLEVLQGGYKSVSSEFSQLAGKVDTPLVTIVRQPTIQQKMTEQFPLLAVDTTSSDNKDTTTSDNTSTTDNTSTSDNTISDNTSTSDNTTRKITF